MRIIFFYPEPSSVNNESWEEGGGGAQMLFQHKLNV